MGWSVSNSWCRLLTRFRTILIRQYVHLVLYICMYVIYHEFFFADIDECDKVNGPSGRCGENAICTNLPGTFACQCEPGFAGNPNTKCSDIDECQKLNACGLGAVCINSVGSYTCECPEGTVPDPDPKSKCNEIVTCNSDVDCPGNAICDNKKQCLCPEPNVGNECRRK